MWVVLSVGNCMILAGRVVVHGLTPLPPLGTALTKKNATPTAYLSGRLRSDPSEHVDLARTEAGVYESMLARFKELEDGYHPPKANPPMDTQGVCDAIRANGGFLRPWK